jgi:signal transduction histidine kinase
MSRAEAEAATATEPRAQTASVRISPRSAPDLLSGVCHDLKAPLASIMMGAAFLRRSLPAEDLAMHRVVDAVYRAADRMSQLVVSFADLARLETGELELRFELHDVGEIVRAAFDPFVAEANAQNVAMSLELEPGLPPSPCDRDRMLQILRQLAVSALRITPEGGHVVVAVDRDAVGATRVQLAARRASAHRSRPLGSELPKPPLTLAKGLIELHGARLTVTGDGDTRTLSFALPGGRA